MKIGGGMERTKAHPRIPSYARTFGATAQPLPNIEYTFDYSNIVPDQNADGYFMGCRGYMLANVASDEDKCIYQNQGTYDRLCAWEGHPITQGGQIIDALNFAAAEGLLRIDERLETDAVAHRRGKWFYVDKVQGMDWFDSHLLAMRQQQKPIAIGTIWFEEWSFTPANWLMTSNFAFDGTWDNELGHCYELSGEKIINGEPAIEVKAWIGRKLYIGREAFNRAFDIYGTASFIQSRFTPSDVLFVKLTLLQHIVFLISNFISKSLAAKFPQNFL